MKNTDHTGVTVDANHAPAWTDTWARRIQDNAGALLIVGGALAICLVVGFVGVLQNAVQRGELFRQQMSMATEPVLTAQQRSPMVVVANNLVTNVSDTRKR
jgi:hypothetical protein